MRRVLVTVKREEDSDGRDLELNAETPARELSRSIRVALGWPDELQHVRIEPGGLRLKADQSLVDAGATDGAWLVFSAEPIVVEAPAPPRTESWPVYVPERHATTQGGPMGLRVLAVIGALLLSVAIGFLLLRPQPATAPQALAAPTAIPTLAAAALPTLAPTVEPTQQPFVPLVVPTIASNTVRTAPTAAPTPQALVLATTAPPSLPTPAPTASVPQDAASLWVTTQAQLDVTWSRDWPRSIALTKAYLNRFPGYAPATEKLYVALVEYGRQLKDAGQLDEAKAQFESAEQVQPQRAEATAELDALLPKPTPVPPPVITQPQPPRVVQPAAPVVPPPAAAPVEPAPAAPAEKQAVTRDGYAP